MIILYKGKKVSENLQITFRYTQFIVTFFLIPNENVSKVSDSTNIIKYNRPEPFEACEACEVNLSFGYDLFLSHKRFFSWDFGIFLYTLFDNFQFEKVLAVHHALGMPNNFKLVMSRKKNSTTIL